jgi:tripartite-type tricarboxylate transporter receptor subunit TctC
MSRPASASVMLAAALSFATPFAFAAQGAKEYPNRPIRLVIPQTAGSSTDTMTRVLAVKLSELTGQQLVIDNRTGVGGLIGAGIVAHADPDGYTLLCASTPSQIIGPQLYAKALTYEPLKGFTAIGQFAVTQNVLITTLKAPFKDVKELIAFARQNP